MSESVKYEKDGGVVTLTLNEPETRNAISPPMVEALVAACNRINDDMSVSCAIVTGAGESFSSGGNVKEMRDRVGLFGGTLPISGAATTGASSKFRWRCTISKFQ